MPYAKIRLATTIRRKFQTTAVGVTVAVLALMATHSVAQDATDAETILLASRDNTISIKGKYVGFENGHYVVETERMGTVRIDAKLVTCEGAPCALALSAATAADPALAGTAAVEAAPVEAAPVEAVVEPAAVVVAEPVPEAPAEAAVTEVAAAEPAPLVEAPPEITYGIHGSRTVGTTLIPTLLRGYAEQLGASVEIIATDDPAIRTVKITNGDGSIRAVIDLQTKGSGSAIKGLIEGAADIGVTDRPMNDGDVEKLTAAGLPDLRDTANETVLGVDGIVLILNTQNPVQDLSAEEVSKIFSGEITNWQQLGGNDLPIVIHSYTEGSGDREVLLNGLVRPFGREETATVQRWEAYQDMVDAVMAEPGALGYVGRWLARSNNVKLMPIREVCGLQSEPSDFRMKIEGYSLSRRLYAFKLPGDIHPEARAFLDWTQSSEAQPYIKEANFIDRELERMRLADVPSAVIEVASAQPDFSQDQYANMTGELGNAERLSLSFRFRFGSSTLDTEAAKTVEQLARLIASGSFDGKEVLIVGFADSVGSRDKNTKLAKARADEVRGILLDVIPTDVAETAKLTSLSFGELMPLSCNDDDLGRERNRRVEVWLRDPA